jgi:hypothetical protein
VLTYIRTMCSSAGSVLYRLLQLVSSEIKLQRRRLVVSSALRRRVQNIVVSTCNCTQHEGHSSPQLGSRMVAFPCPRSQARERRTGDIRQFVTFMCKRRRRLQQEDRRRNRLFTCMHIPSQHHPRGLKCVRLWTLHPLIRNKRMSKSDRNASLGYPLRDVIIRRVVSTW